MKFDILHSNEYTELIWYESSRQKLCSYENKRFLCILWDRDKLRCLLNIFQEDATKNMNIRKGWVNENQCPKRCSAQSLEIRLTLLLLIKTRAVVSSCLYRESTQLLISRFMRAHQIGVPSPGRAVSHVLQKHDSSGAGRHTCSVDPKVPPVCVVVWWVVWWWYREANNLRTPGLTTCPQ